MARSNNPPQQPGGWPKPVAQGHAAEEGGQPRIGFPLNRPAAAAQPVPTIYPQGTHPQAASGYGFGAPADRGQQSSYPPAFENPVLQDPRQQYAAAQQGGYHYPPQQHAAPPPRLPTPQVPNPYQPHGQQAPQWPQGPGPDPRTFDPNAYPQAGQRPPSFSEPAPGWPQHDSYDGGGTDDPGYAAFGSQAHFDAGYGQPAAYAQQPEQDNIDGFAQEQAVYETEEPRRRSGGMVLVACALVGAIAVGGGLAYAYRTLVGPEPTGATPVVRGDTPPARMRPADAGGKQLALPDNKVTGRVSDSTAPPLPAETAEPAPVGETESSSARKVPTFAVSRDGALLPPQPSAEPSTQAPSVPGLMLDDGGQFATRQTSGPAPVARGEPPPASAPRADPQVTTTSSLRPREEQPAGAAPPPAKPAVIARPSPPEEETTVAAIEPPPVEPRRPPPAKRSTAAPPAAPSAAPAPDGSGGFVAVLASVPVSANSRMEALKLFADLQQKYSSVLQNKTPEVREVNLGEKGPYQRVMVGPPGSREQASALCSGLKSAGYPSCWVTAF